MLELLEATLRLSTPLILGAMGGIIAERSGVVTLCLEGVMLLGAWSAASVAYATDNPWAGLLAGSLTGVLAMSLHSSLVLLGKADAVISGIAVNFLAAGLTPVLNKVLFQSPTTTPSLSMQVRFSYLFSDEFLIYVALLLPLVCHFLFSRTRYGMRVIAAGDGPDALKTAGVSVKRIRFSALALGGFFCGLAGTFLSISHVSQFTRDMTAGRGFIALTALIFGRQKPIPTLLICLFFGFADGLQMRLQGVSLFGTVVPVQLIQSLPYILALLIR